jgi:beta-phosphoglucomutase-like phosphatase (HAD superfamily)
MTIAVLFDAILFDFDGVLIDSEYRGNKQIAEYLTGIGIPTSPEQSMAQFMGLAGRDFHAALERTLGGPIPDSFHEARAEENLRAMTEGYGEVAGAIAFVRSLPADLPVAITSSSSTEWIAAHLAHLGLADRFAGRMYSGREHVTHGKPAPDLYLHAASALGVPMKRCAIIEDSPVGATGAVASGAYVIGLCAGSHCGPGHADVLRSKGVQAIAHSFDDIQRMVSAPSVVS